MQFGFSLAMGDVTFLDGRWYVTHAGLIRLARHNRCAGINVRPVPMFLILLYSAGRLRQRFLNLEHAKASSVTATPIRPTFPHSSAEQRCAWPKPGQSTAPCARPMASASARSRRSGRSRVRLRSFLPKTRNGNGNGSRPKVRDRLCQIIRQHKLDPELVKAYAVDFCGTKTLREASREQVENFVQQLADWAEKDRNALLCQLNSYAHPKQEVVA